MAQWTWRGRKLSRSMLRLGEDIDRAFPDRDHSKDGAEGDAAHRARVSGHNPDDTPGTRAEYSDTDTTPEVRAVDVGDTLRGTATMHAVLARLLTTPQDARRLKYVIYRGRIARKATGWRWEDYDGPNPHAEYAHLSGDPEYDNDDRPWSVLALGEDDMDLDDKIGEDLTDNPARTVRAGLADLFNLRNVLWAKPGAPAGKFSPPAGSPLDMLTDLPDQVAQLGASVSQLQRAVEAGAIIAPDIDYREFARALLAELAEQGREAGQ